jgi:putative flippase GtrA
MFFRYIIVQILAYGLDMGGFLLLLKMDIFEPVAANIAGKFTAGIFGFIANRNFTFLSSDDVDIKKQAFRYFVLLALNIPFSTAILGLFLLWINEPAVAKFLADGIGVLLTYIISKKFIFTSQTEVSD